MRINSPAVLMQRINKPCDAGLFFSFCLACTVCHAQSLTPRADLGEALAMLARLKAMLEASDADAADAYRNLAEILRGAVDTMRLDALGAAVNGFDYDAALLELDGIAKEYGVDK